MPRMVFVNSVKQLYSSRTPASARNGNGTRSPAKRQTTQFSVIRNKRLHESFSLSAHREHEQRRLVPALAILLNAEEGMVV